MNPIVIYGCPPDDLSPRIPTVPVLPEFPPPAVHPMTIIPIAELDDMRRRIANLECRLAAAEGRIAILERKENER